LSPGGPKNNENRFSFEVAQRTWLPSKPLSEKQELASFPEVSEHQKNHRRHIPVEREKQPLQPEGKG